MIEYFDTLNGETSCKLYKIHKNVFFKRFVVLLLVVISLIELCCINGKTILDSQDISKRKTRFMISYFHLVDNIKTSLH